MCVEVRECLCIYFVYERGSVCVCVCVCVCVLYVCGGRLCVRVFVTNQDIDLYNDTGMTQVLQGEGDFSGH